VKFVQLPGVILVIFTGLVIVWF